MTTAEKIIVAVSKHDENAARVMLADCAVQNFEGAAELYYGPVLTAVVAKLEALRPEVIRRAGRRYVSKSGSEPVDTAAIEDLDALVEVCKASQTQHWVEIQGSRHQVTAMRDEKGRFSSKPGKGGSDPGSWTRTGSGKQNSAPANVQQQLFDEGGSAERGSFQGQAAGDPEEQKQIKEYLGRVKEVRSILRDMNASFGEKSDLKLKVEFENPNVDPVVFAAGQDPSKVEWDMASGATPDRYIAAEPKGFTAPNKAKLGAIMGANQPGGMGMNEVRHYAKEILDQRDLEASGAQKAGTLMNTGAKLADMAGMRGLGAALKTGNKAVAIGEDLRPTLARAAYRYRGTERKPEQTIVEAASFADLAAPEAAMISELMRHPAKPLNPQLREQMEELYTGGYDAGSKQESNRRAYQIMGLAQDRVSQFESESVGGEVPQQRLLMALQRDTVAQELLKRMMHKQASGAQRMGGRREGAASMNDLVTQLASGIGRGLPSEGVLINDEGTVVSQSVGMGGDNYQPFTAKALGKLDGGQYVRTRASGGISPDDVRTLLLSGGRSAMVVSTGGVFDLEFDPRFRGNKRFSDKALQMTDTYTRILDQLAAKKIYTKDLPADVRNEVMEQSAAMSGAQPGSAEFQTQFKADLAAKRAQLSQVSTSDRAKLKADALKQHPKDPFLEKEAYKALLKEKEKENVRALSLNGEGYEVALRTLQSYYPYWIRGASRRSPVDLAVGNKFDGRTKQALMVLEGGPDNEYVAPGNVRSGDDPNAATGRPNKMSVTVAADERREVVAEEKRKVGAEPDGTAAAASAVAGGPGAPAGGAGGAGVKGGSAATAATVAVDGPPLVKAMNVNGQAGLDRMVADISNSFNKALIVELAKTPSGATDLSDLMNDYNVDLQTGNEGEAPFARTSDVNARALVATLTKPEVLGSLVEAYRQSPEETSERLDVALASLATQTKTPAILDTANLSNVMAKRIAASGLTWQAPNDGFDGSPQLFDYLKNVDAYVSEPGRTSITDAKATSQFVNAANGLGSKLLSANEPIIDQAAVVTGYRDLFTFVKDNADAIKTGSPDSVKVMLDGLRNREVTVEALGGDPVAQVAALKAMAVNPDLARRKFNDAKIIYSGNYLSNVSEMLKGVSASPKALAHLGLRPQTVKVPGRVRKSDMAGRGLVLRSDVLELSDVSPEGVRAMVLFATRPLQDGMTSQCQLSSGNVEKNWIGPRVPYQTWSA